MSSPYALATPNSPASPIAPGVPRLVSLDRDVAIEFVEQGDSNGLPMVFLHGMGDSWRSFEGVLPFLPPNIRAFAVSLRGHGRSSRPPGGYGSGDFSDDVARLLDAVGVGRAVVVGHSMGSLAAQRFALDHAGRVEGLVLIGASPTLCGNLALLDLWQTTIAELSDPVDPAFVRTFQESTISRPVAAGLIDTAIAESLLVPAAVWRAAFAGLFRDRAVAGRAQRRNSHGGQPGTVRYFDDRVPCFPAARRDDDPLFARIHRHGDAEAGRGQRHPVAGDTQCFQVGGDHNPQLRQFGL
jgi:pimeloyl-ACP methyl ester carboxylesterase